MTKNRAAKQAARARAAATGQRYVVARREVPHEPTPVSHGTLHELTHRVPGVPAHIEGGLQANRSRAHGNRVHQHPAHQHGEPRVLVGWQNRIARLFSAK